MSKKFYAQILIEVELDSETRVSAEVEARNFSNHLQVNTNDAWERKCELISTNIIQDPPEQEWLENLVCAK